MSEYEVILDARNLVNYYDTHGSGILGPKHQKKVLSDVSFSIRRGEVFGVVGESGCGKSTLSKAVLGLIDYQGEIRIDGELLKARQTKAQRRKVQMVFQDPQGALNPKKRVGWILNEPLKIHRVGTQSEQNAAIDAMLELIGLDPSYKTRFPNELSGGQKQRICIGSALMLEPALLVADEPVSALDVSAGAQILNLLDKLHRRLNLSILFISHNLNVVYYLCDRIAVMYKGQIVEQGDAREIYNNPLHPYTRALLAAIPDIEEVRAYKKPLKAELVERPPAGPDACGFYSNCPHATPRCGEEAPGFTGVARGTHGVEKEHHVRCHRFPAEAAPAF